MAKRVSTKKKINRKLYVAKATLYKRAPRKALVDELQAVLLRPQFKKVIKHIDRISVVTGGNTSSKRVTTGRVVNKDGKKFYKIYDYSSLNIEYYRAVAVHELAHVDWGVKQKWHHEAWTKFNTIVNELRPINEYLERNEAKWRADKRFLTSNQYCNEMHSAAAELYYEAENSGHRFQYPEDQKKLLAAFKELHSLE